MKCWLLGLVLGLFCCQHATASENSLSSVYMGSRESDPESLVENVSTIHGDYTEVEVDLVVPSPDSLILSRFYSSRDTIQTATFGGWRFNPHCFLSIQKDTKTKAYTTAEGKFEHTYVYIGNPDGTILTYIGWQNASNLSKRSLFKIDPEEEAVGLSNTAKGNISHWTNLKSNELYFDPQTNSFELFLCSEGKRFYAKHPSLDVYLITHEILPSGNKVFYAFDEKGQLSLIRETNASEKKVLAWIKFQYSNGIHVETSDGKTADYHFQQGPSGAPLLTEVVRTNKPDIQYQYQVLDNHTLLLRKTLPEGRFVQVDYYTDKVNRHKVRAVTTPTDSNETASIQFSYGDGYTEIHGFGKSKSIHRFDENNQLVAIEHYLDGSLYRVHKKAWGVKREAGNLISTSIEDDSGNIFYYTSFKYDDDGRGNIIEEHESGNLTGANVNPLSIDRDGKSDQDAHIKTYSYFADEKAHGFSQKDEKGTGLKCWYKKGTGLLIKKFLLSKRSSDREGIVKKRYFYEYNEDAALIKVVVDDGGENGFWQGEYIPVPAEGHITLIAPKQTLPNVGAPEIIEEKYYELEENPVKKYIATRSKNEVLLKRTVNQFNAQGLIASQAVYDANGVHRYTIVKDYVNGLLSFETDQMGNKTHYVYDVNNNLIQVSRLDTGVSIEYGYDLKNRLIYTVEKNKMGNRFETHATYDSAGYKLSETDRFGNEMLYENDSLGRPIHITYPEMSDGPHSFIRPKYTYTYDLFNNVLSVTDTKGRCITQSCTSRGQPTTIHHVDGTSELFKYDHEGSLHRYLGRDGHVQVFEYDYIGRLNHIEYYRRDSRGSNEGFKRKYYEYNTFHLISEQDEMEEKTYYTYDGAGRLTAVRKGDQKLEFIYDALGRTEGVKKWQSSSTFTLEVREYDLLNRVVEQRTQDSQEHVLTRNKYIYNSARQLAQVIAYPQNQESVLTRYEYDDFGRLCKIIGTSNQETQIFYDDAYVNSQGQKTQKRTLIDPLGTQTEEIFDISGHIIKVTKRDKKGHLLAEVESSYDLSGNKVLEKAARISAEGLLSTYETEWSFNQRNQLQSVTLGKGSAQTRVTAFEYNSYGDLAAQYNPGSNDPITYQYEDDGNLQTISYKERKKEITHKFFSYDERGDLTDLRLASGQGLVYSYDANSQPLDERTIDECGFYEVHYTYDGAGNIQTVKLPDGSFIEYSYEGPFVKTVRRFTKGKKELYQYCVASRDQMGNCLEEILPGHCGGRKQFWDSSGKRIEISTDCFQDKVHYDLLENIEKREITLDDEKSTKEYAYNALAQLTLEKGELAHQYSYDSIGNRLRKDGLTYQVDALNQLVDVEGVSYTFDPNGNLATKTKGGRTWLYEWNPLNQLVFIKDPDENVVTFSYDLSGRRLTKRIETKNEKTQKFRFFYLGNTEIGCLNEKGVIVELKVPSDPNNPEFSPCVAFELKEETYVPLYDLQGNVICLLNKEKRKIAESYHYTAFGEEAIINARGRTVSDSIIGNHWRYRGKRVDKEVGLIYFGQRYYDPEVGRWISPDPAGDIDGPNLYTFARNNPMTYVDYFGLATEMNENQSKEFIGYFYGEYEPRCHCEAHRDCKRGGDIANSVAGINYGVVGAILNNPQFQGSMQALGGLAEASAGSTMILLTNGAAAPAGWPLVVHGLDHFVAGINTMVSGRPIETLTSQLLQKTGLSQEAANRWDYGANFFGTLVTGGVIYKAGREAAVTMASINQAKAALSNEKTLFDFTGTAGKHMYEVERRIPVHILENMIKSPIAVVKDPRGASNAMMYYSQIWKNGRLYNAEVLYDKTTNIISHFRYSRDPMGPLKKAPKTSE